MNPATKALGSAANQSSLLKFEGIAPKTLFKRFSLEYIAAADPLCPSNSCTKHDDKFRCSDKKKMHKQYE